MTTTTGDGIFKRLGVFIRWWYALRDMKDTLEALLGDAASNRTAMKEFIGSAPLGEDKDAYEAISVEIRRQKEELESTRQSVVNLVSEFFATDVKALLDSPYSTPEAVLDHLLDAMDDNDDHVLKNDVGIVGDDGHVEQDEDNSVELSGENADFGVKATQMARDDRFALTCVDDSAVGGERWTLESARQGQYYGEVVTGQAVNWDAAGIEGLKIPTAPAHDEDDEHGKVSSWTLESAMRGSNVSADGHLYLTFNSAPTLTVENDDDNQLDDVDITPGEFGEESDTDGKQYVSIVKQQPVVVPGESIAEFDDVVLIGTTGDNTDSGTLYVKVTKAAGSQSGSKYTIQLYKDSDRTNYLKASGDQDNVLSLPTEITVSHETSGVSGSITLTDYDGPIGSDSEAEIQASRYYVRVYRSSSRSAEDLVAEGFSLEAEVDDMAVASVSGCTTSGTTDLDYATDTEDIVLTGLYYTIDAYRADPEDLETTTDDIVARAGTTANLLTGATLSDLAFCEVNGSGLDSLSVTVENTNITSYVPYTASARIGFANGDKFTFDTECTQESLFQTFLRDTFGTVFPAETVEETPEVQEDWAITPEHVIEQEAADAQLAADKAAVDAVKTSIKSTVTGLLGTVNGSLTLPDASNVASDAPAFGVGGNGSTPSYPTTATSKTEQLESDTGALLDLVTAGNLCGVIALDPDDVSAINTWTSTNGAIDASTAYVSFGSIGLTHELLFANLVSLLELTLDSNSITVPPVFQGCDNLQTLSISAGALTAPPDVSGLTCLQTLYLNANNSMGSAPDLSTLSYLLDVNLSYCGLNESAVDGVLSDLMTAGVTGAVIDVSNNASPSDVGMGNIRQLCITNACEVYCDVPVTVEGVPGGSAPVTQQTYSYVASSGAWIGDYDSGASIYYDGCDWTLVQTCAPQYVWLKSSDNESEPFGIYGTYVCTEWGVPDVVVGVYVE